jgi:hypothetical protein
LVDVVKQAEGKILRYATGADIGCVETGTGNTFVKFLDVISKYNLQYRHMQLTMSFSRSSNPHKKGVRAPTSMA